MAIMLKNFFKREVGAISKKMESKQYQVLLENVDKIHTTELGIKRIQKNAHLLENDDAISWCKALVMNPKADIVRRGKNWYVTLFPYEVTINAYSYTIITVHSIKASK